MARNKKHKNPNQDLLNDERDSSTISRIGEKISNASENNDASVNKGNLKHSGRTDDPGNFNTKSSVTGSDSDGQAR